MSVPSDRFGRAAGRVNLDLLRQKLVVIVGVGTVGSQVAWLLANSGIGGFRFIDGDKLEESNLARHALPSAFVGMNKAEALKLYMMGEVNNIYAEAERTYIDASISDDAVDEFFLDGNHVVDLVIAATDNREAQRRIGQRTLALDVLAVFPALDRRGGGEVFVQWGSEYPCFMCWDGFRPETAAPRAVSALNVDALTVIQDTVELAIGLLDEASEYSRLLRPQPDDPQPPQLFVRRRFASLEPRRVPWRSDCPSCAVGPAPHVVATEATHEDDTLLRLRTEVQRTLAWTLGALAILMIVGFIIINTRIHEETALGLVSVVVIIVNLWILYVNTSDLMTAWRRYRSALRRQANDR